MKNKTISLPEDIYNRLRMKKKKRRIISRTYRSFNKRKKNEERTIRKPCWFFERG